MLAYLSRWCGRHLFDVRIDPMTMEEVLSAVEMAIERRERLLIGVVNAAKLVNMHRDPALRRAVLGADVILADGMSVVWACRMLRRPVPERVAGIDLMTRMLELADARQYRVFCLGATDAVLEAVAERIRREFPRAVLVGARNGYFNEEEEADLATVIAEARPDILFVAMTSPKKEKFLAHWTSRMGVPVCHGVGGAFDVMAGKTRRAPRIWQRLGMEWLYRAMQEPARLGRRYLVTNSVFVGMFTREAARRVGRMVRLPSSRSSGAMRRSAGRGR